MVRPLCQKRAGTTHPVLGPRRRGKQYSARMAKRSHDPVDPDSRHNDDVSGEIPVEDTQAVSSAPVPVDDADHSPTAREGSTVPETAGGPLGSAWVGLVLGALVTILLLIFIAQNTTDTDVRYLGLQFSLPLGVLILFAAIAGALIMALFAGFRILQLRMRARKARKMAGHAH